MDVNNKCNAVCDTEELPLARREDAVNNRHDVKNVRDRRRGWICTAKATLPARGV